MPAAAYATYRIDRVDPIQDPEDARAEPVNLQPGTYLKGTVLGQISGANTNDVQTITISGSPTHSTLTITGLPGGLSYTAVQDVSPAALQTALNALLGASSVGVTGTANASYVITWGGNYANQPVPLLGVSAAFSGGTSPAVAIAHTTPGVGPNGAYAAYNSGNTDGTQTAKGILMYSCTVDALGNVSYGAVRTYRGTPMWYKGTFATDDLVGLDAGAVTNLGGHLLKGTTTSGKLSF